MTEPMNPYAALENPENYFSQSFLLGIINSVCYPIFVKNRQHQWIFINNAFCQLTGYNSEELIGKSDYEFFSNEEAEIFRETDELIFSSGVSNNSEGYFFDAEGKRYFSPIQKNLFNDESGNQFLICNFKEIRASGNKPREEKVNSISLSVLKAINNLLNISDFDESLNSVLENLGNSTNVEQVSIIAVKDNQNWKWSNNNLKIELKIELDIFPQWHEILSRGEIITGSVNDFPKSEREVLNAAGVRSTLLIPIQVRENFWGYIRFDNCQKDYSWSDSDKSILQAAAVTLGTAIYHYQQQEKLVKSKHFLQLVVDSIPQIIFWKDCNSVFLGCNQRLADIWGLSSVEEIAGKTDNDVSTPQEKSEWYREWDKRVIESGVPELHIVEKKQKADGKHKWLDTNKIPLLDEENNVVGVLATIEDITERKQVEEALGQKEEFLRTIYDGVELGIVVYEVTEDNAFHYFGINKATELLSGYQSQQIVGKTPCEVFGKEFGEVIEKRNLDCLLNKESVSFEETVKILDKEIFLLTTLTPLLDERGGVYRIISTSTDITAQKQAETTLRESEEKFHQLSKNVPGMLYKFQMDSDGSMSFPYVSPGSYELLGIVAEEIQAEFNVLISMIHSEDYKTFEKSLKNSAETFEAFYWEGRLVQSSENIQWVKAESRPKKQSDGSIIWDGFLSDITHLKKTKKALQKAYGEMESLVLKRTKELTKTNKVLKAEIEERKNTEAVLRETEAKLQKLAANVPGMLYQFEVNPDGSISFPYVSPGCYEIYGLQPEQIEADADYIFSMTHPEDLKAFKYSYISSAKNLKPWEHEGRIVLTSGEVKWIKSDSRPEKLENGTILYHGFILDITERKQAEKALLRSNAMLEAQQEAAIDGILFVDENQNILSYNQHFVELWQISESVIETRDEQQFLTSIISQLTNSPKFINEVENLYNDVEKSVRDEIDLGDGRTFECYCAPVNSAEGEYFGRVWYFRDITERKQAEAKLRQQTQELENALQKLQNAQVQLIQSEKMSSLGQLVAGIAHEINNPVNFIDANLKYAQEYFDDLLKLIKIYQNDSLENLQAEEFIQEIEFDYLQEDLPNIISSMKTGAKRIGNIVLSLRTFSRLDEAEFKIIDIHESIDSTLMVLQNSLEPKSERVAIVVTKEFNELPLVECFAGKLNQVFLNILNNAIYALEEAIKHHKFLGNEYPHIRISTKLIERNTVQISIIDNGCGIPENNLNKLFDPFFTTKPVGQGTGLGLSISYQIIVEQHKGQLNCISTVGKGTEFQIQVPVKGSSK